MTRYVQTPWLRNLGYTLLKNARGPMFAAIIDNTCWLPQPLFYRIMKPTAMWAYFVKYKRMDVPLTRLELASE